jgi:hypothetical protein
MYTLTQSYDLHMYLTGYLYFYSNIKYNVTNQAKYVCKVYLSNRIVKQWRRHFRSGILFHFFPCVTYQVRFLLLDL